MRPPYGSPAASVVVLAQGGSRGPSGRSSAAATGTLALEACLAALDAQTTAARHEIIVVVDPANPAAGPLQFVCGRYRARVVEATGSPGIRRNAGWRAARGRVIAFTSEDTTVEPGWLEAGLRPFARRVPSGRLPGAVAGRVLLPEHYVNDGLPSTLALSGFVRRAVLEASGGFDKALRHDHGGYDLELLLRRQGYRIVDAADAVAIRRPAQRPRWRMRLAALRRHEDAALLERARMPRPAVLRAYAATGGLLWAAYRIGRRRRRRYWLGGLVYLADAAIRMPRGHPRSHRGAWLIEMIAALLIVYWRLRGALRARRWFL